MPSAPWAPHGFVAADAGGSGRVASWQINTSTYGLQVEAGGNTISFKPKLRAGRYKLELLITAGGEKVTDTAKLRVRR